MMCILYLINDKKEKIEVFRHKYYNACIGQAKYLKNIKNMKGHFMIYEQITEDKGCLHDINTEILKI